MYTAISGLGIVILLIVAWLFSPQKRLINWRLIGWGIVLQMIFAVFIFYVPAGSKLFVVLNDVVVKILDSATAGARFVFGPLAIPPGSGEESIGSILAFQSFPTIIFFSALMAILYYFNIIPWIIRGFAYVFTKLMRISGAESLSAASNIFVGIESAFTIKPHLKEMTRSELFTVLTVGMSTVASNVLAIYIFSLKEHFPMIGGHLISASFISAPAALIMSKLVMPEKDVPATLGKDVKPHYEKESNVFSAIINGANSGVRLIVGIVALLIAIISLVELIDLFLGWIGGFIGGNIDWSLKGLLGYVFYPFTAILGIPISDVDTISKIIGERMVVTEVTAYKDLAAAIANGTIQNPRTIVITTYALCGFAHVGSMAIFIGGIGALVPDRTSTLAKFGLRALVAATLACLMTGCIAGLFANENTILMSGM
ncbi:MAG: NupC/NupG family nucleoside CNT transporter [bacterium]